MGLIPSGVLNIGMARCNNIKRLKHYLALQNRKRPRWTVFALEEILPLIFQNFGSFKALPRPTVLVLAYTQQTTTFRSVCYLNSAGVVQE